MWSSAVYFQNPSQRVKNSGLRTENHNAPYITQHSVNDGVLGYNVLWTCKKIQSPYCLHLQGWRRQYASPKCWYLSIYMSTRSYNTEDQYRYIYSLMWECERKHYFQFLLVKPSAACPYDLWIKPMFEILCVQGGESLDCDLLICDTVYICRWL